MEQRTNECDYKYSSCTHLKSGFPDMVVTMISWNVCQKRWELPLTTHWFLTQSFFLTPRHHTSLLHVLCAYACNISVQCLIWVLDRWICVILRIFKPWAITLGGHWFWHLFQSFWNCLFVLDWSVLLPVALFVLVHSHSNTWIYDWGTNVGSTGTQ